MWKDDYLNINELQRQKKS